MADLNDLALIPLICPACGLRLPSGEDDAVFFCVPCQAAWEPFDGQLRRRELSAVAGSGSEQLPFWIFPFRLETPDASCATAAEFRRLTGNINPLEERQRDKPPLLFAPAFSSGKPQQMLRVGRLLTLRAPLLRPGERKLEGIVPVTLGEESAGILGRAVVVATLALERRRNRAFLETFTLRLGRGRLFVIPFTARENTLFNAEMNLEI